MIKKSTILAPLLAAGKIQKSILFPVINDFYTTACLTIIAEYKSFVGILSKVTINHLHSAKILWIQDVQSKLINWKYRLDNKNNKLS